VTLLEVKGGFQPLKSKTGRKLLIIKFRKACARVVGGIERRGKSFAGRPIKRILGQIVGREARNGRGDGGKFPEGTLGGTQARWEGKKSQFWLTYQMAAPRWGGAPAGSHV